MHWSSNIISNTLSHTCSRQFGYSLTILQTIYSKLYTPNMLREGALCSRTRNTKASPFSFTITFLNAVCTLRNAQELQFYVPSERHRLDVKEPYHIPDKPRTMTIHRMVSRPITDRRQRWLNLAVTPLAPSLILLPVLHQLNKDRLISLAHLTNGKRKKQKENLKYIIGWKVVNLSLISSPQ